MSTHFLNPSLRKKNFFHFVFLFFPERRIQKESCYSLQKGVGETLLKFNVKTLLEVTIPPKRGVEITSPLSGEARFFVELLQSFAHSSLREGGRFQKAQEWNPPSQGRVSNFSTGYDPPPFGGNSNSLLPFLSQEKIKKQNEKNFFS